MKKIIQIFASCKVVKGYTRALIYDLGRNKIHFIPLELADFISSLNGIYLEEFDGYRADPIRKSYIDFLEKNEIIFSVLEKDASHFVNHVLEFDFPGHLNTAILEINVETTYSIHEAIDKLEKAGCEHIVFFSANIMDINRVQELLSFFHDTRFHQIEMITKYSTSIKINSLRELFIGEPRLRKISLHSALSNKMYSVLGKASRIFLFQEELKSFPIPKTDYGYFAINYPMFVEANVANPFYNGKIFIDGDGFTKANPYESVNFGHISKINFEEVIKSSLIQNLWKTSKDMIDICKDCELRYMCLDSRVPINATGERIYHSTECNYNPYICKWVSEEGYLSLEEIGIKVSDSEFKIDVEQLENTLQFLYNDEV